MKNGTRRSTRRWFGLVTGLWLVAVATLGVGRASAANYTWTNTANGASGYWTNGALWGSANYPGQTAVDSAYLTNATPGATAYTNILDFTLANPINNLVISNSLGQQAWLIVTNATLINTNLYLGNSGRLQIDNGGVVTNAGLTWRGTNGTIYLNSGGKLVASANITIGGTGVSGVTATVTRTGTSLPAGIWDFNGKTLAFGGNTNVLRVDGGGVTGGVVLTNIAASTLVSGAGNELILTNGAKLTTGNNQQINTKGILTIVGGGAPGVTTVAEFVGGLLQIGNFTSEALIRVDGNGVASGAVLAASNLYIGAAGAQTSNGLSIVNGGRVDASIILSYSGGVSNYLNVGSAGAASYLVGNVTLGRAGGGYNTMTTTNAVIGGSLSIGDGTAVNNSNTVTVLKDTAWNFNNGGLTFAALGNSTGNVMVINGGVVSNVLAVVFGSTGASVGSSLTVSNGGQLFSGNVTVGNSANSSSNAYNVGGFGLSSTVTNGTLIVGNTRAGFNTLTVTNATLQSGAGTIGSGSSNNTATVNAGGTWNLLGNNLTVGSGAATGNVLRLDGGAITNAGTVTFTLTGGAGNTLLLNGGKLSTTALTATNASMLVTFNSGVLSTRRTTINNGAAFVVGNGTDPARLELLGGFHSFAAGLTINSGATLSGTGTVVSATSVNGSISPGFSLGTMVFSNSLTLAGTATAVFELKTDANGGNGGNDKIVIGPGGSLDLGSATLSLALDQSAGAVTNGTQFLLIDNQTASAITGIFGGYGQSTTNDIGGVSYEFNYFGGTGNDLMLTVVPEPSALTLVGVGLIAATVLLRRRRGAVRG